MYSPGARTATRSLVTRRSSAPSSQSATDWRSSVCSSSVSIRSPGRTYPGTFMSSDSSAPTTSVMVAGAWPVSPCMYRLYRSLISGEMNTGCGTAGAIGSAAAVGPPGNAVAPWGAAVVCDGVVGASGTASVARSDSMNSSGTSGPGSFAWMRALDRLRCSRAT